ncbi:Apolipoprotein N-acyltransferase [Sphingomonas gellani]|uniref:Apolipoprotein N-acyltransferase n=1 Tax=Sphingomonas gellani TaxID=1166340 RepID=A0A1H8B688_9SPHN|nr:apolipoprotein N-acyltransferase [Sphingomonas gellani]SEM78263.1 Apolipoprotein N-acyltransferase [Sphingomonas gellani]
MTRSLRNPYPALSCILLGAVAALGFAPLDLWPLTLLGLAGWMLLVHGAPTGRQALWRGWLWGVGHFTINNNWFQHAFDFQDKMPPVLGYFAAVALALYLAVYPAMAAGIAWRVRGVRAGGDVATPDAGFVLAFGAAWIATEWLRAVMFTGYAWDPLGVTWLPLIGVARLSAWIGTYALSGVAVLAAGAMALLAFRRWTLAAIMAPLLALSALSAPWTRAPDTGPGDPIVRIVQPNIGQDTRGEDDAEPVLRALLALSGRPGPSPRLVLWPEGVVRDLLEDGYPLYYYRGRYPWVIRRRIAAVLGPRDLLLAGTTPLRFDGQENLIGASNSVRALDASTRLGAQYDKAHLVPYGEYLPMPWLLKPLGLSRLVPGDLDFDEGPGPRNLALPGFGAVGVQICYEIIFSGQVVDRAHRPRMLFNPSNDAWFGRWGPPQHLAQARMRAIEEGLPILRATPTGISAMIAPDGRLLATVPHERAGAIERRVPPALAPTLFARTGNWMALLLTVLLALAAIAARRRQR